MSQKCTVCYHPLRREVEDAVLAGDSFRRIGAAFGLSKDALSRHYKHLRLGVVRDLPGPPEPTSHIGRLVNELRPLLETGDPADHLLTEQAARLLSNIRAADEWAQANGGWMGPDRARERAFYMDLLKAYDSIVRQIGLGVPSRMSVAAFALKDRTG